MWIGIPGGRLDGSPGLLGNTTTPRLHSRGWTTGSGRTCGSPLPRADTFHFDEHHIDWASGEVSLAYRVDRDIAFVERFAFPVPERPTAEVRAAVERAVRLLHLVAGVSYFKAFLPPRIEVHTQPLDPELAQVLTTLYRNGLGEFGWRNGLPEVGRVSFPAGAAAAPGLAAASGNAAGFLVPVGGGKDSAVVLRGLADEPVPHSAFSVGDREPMRATARVAGYPHVVAERRLDPRLFEENAKGAYNGHVPVTAIVSLAAVITALLHGHDTVVMANERSASSPNVAWPEAGMDVNHQFSKGWWAEAALRRLVHRHVAADVGYYSLLRPFSELAVLRAFATMPQFHDVFVSCNSAYRIRGDDGSRWCGDCPKCRFVFLGLAPFVERDHLVGIFGRDLLRDASQRDGFAALLEVDGAHKPFECVGEVGEARAAMGVLAGDDAWRDADVVRALAGAYPTGAEAGRHLDAALVARTPHAVPAGLLERVRAAVGL